MSEGAQHGPHHSKSQLPDSAPVLRLKVVGLRLGTRLTLERLLETEKIRLTERKQPLWLSSPEQIQYPLFLLSLAHVLENVNVLFSLF